MDYRDYIVGLDKKVPLKNGKKVTSINFDNAATTPPFKSVINEIVNFAPWYASINRSYGYKSELSTKLYNDSRKTVLDFVNADSSFYTVIYVKNTTEAINKLAYTLYNSKSPGSMILSSEMEHHSNDLPWRNKFPMDYIKIDRWGRLLLEDLEYKLKKYDGKVRLVAITGASNVTGYINPIYEAAMLAHKYGAEILVDGAQLVPHCRIKLGRESDSNHIDYLAFSAHKMYAPFGTGVLIGPKKTFEYGAPSYSGGGTIKIVTKNCVVWEDPPLREEAGSPNVMGALALDTSIKTIKSIGMDNIEKYENRLTEYALKRLDEIQGITIYCNKNENTRSRVCIVPFNIDGIFHETVAEALSGEGGISVRSGCFCAHPYVQELLNLPKDELDYYVKNPDESRPGMIRISFGLYNTFSEIDKFMRVLKKIVKSKKYYIKKYS